MGGGGRVEGIQPLPHHRLVLGVHEGVRTGEHLHPGCLELVQEPGRDVLVVERDHVRLGSEPAYGLWVLVVAHWRIGDGLGGGDRRALRQHAQLDPQRDGRLLRHPGQLSAADHPDHGGPGRQVLTLELHTREPNVLTCAAVWWPARISVQARSAGTVRSCPTAPRVHREHSGPLKMVTTLYRQVEHLVHEVAKFGLVGLLGTVVDLPIYNWLVFDNPLIFGTPGDGVFHHKPLTAKVISTTIATVATYLGNRHWTWRHRERTGLHREYVLFFVLNAIGLLIAAGCLRLLALHPERAQRARRQHLRERDRPGPRHPVPLLVLPQVRLHQG